MMFLTICVILFNICIALLSWRILKCNGIEMDAIQQDKMSLRVHRSREIPAVHGLLHMGWEGQLKSGSDLPGGKKAIAVLVIGEG